MTERQLDRQLRSARGWATTRLFLVQAVFVGAAASLWLFLTVGLQPRAIGFALFAGVAACGLMLQRREDSRLSLEQGESQPVTAEKS